jgi:hypothetical protein
MCAVCGAIDDLAGDDGPPICGACLAAIAYAAARDVVVELNAQGLTAPDGSRWSVEAFIRYQHLLDGEAILAARSARGTIN